VHQIDYLQEVNPIVGKGVLYIKGYSPNILHVASYHSKYMFYVMLTINKFTWITLYTDTVNQWP